MLTRVDLPCGTRLLLSCMCWQYFKVRSAFAHQYPISNAWDRLPEGSFDFYFSRVLMK